MQQSVLEAGTYKSPSSSNSSDPVTFMHVGGPPLLTHPQYSSQIQKLKGPVYAGPSLSLFILLRAQERDFHFRNHPFPTLSPHKWKGFTSHCSRGNPSPQLCALA